jgi:D-alanyl-lipoteichoic acid acyltransferase DltB (MBOAT superfamily)
MSWRVEYVFLIVASTLVDYFCGILMERQATKKRKLPFLLFSVCANLGMLFVFKYLNFATANVNLLFDRIGVHRHIPMMTLLLPVGISFYTFQTMSYSIDVFLGRQKAERHLGYFSLYVSFFPQLVAGPIERFSRLSPQLRARYSFSYDNLANGLRLILYGLFVKMVVADNLAVVVDAVYRNPANFSSLNLLIGLLCYSFQIYGDFYGYSLIAVGSARLMGITIMDNFKTPYFARNIAEFWQRWHISLSTWFRDYLYFPLGGSRVKKCRWLFNIMMVFVVSGIWHGANWNFLVWGALFGVVYLIERGCNQVFGIKASGDAFRPVHLLLVAKTFIVVTFVWIFFRSQSLGEAVTIVKLLQQNAGLAGKALDIPNYLWFWLAIFIISDAALYNKRFDIWLGRFPFAARWTIYTVLIVGIIVFAGVSDSPFIYFQF